MAQPLNKRMRLAISDLETLSRISEDMDVTESRSGAGAQELDGTRYWFNASEEFEKLLRKSAAFIDKTLFIKDFFRGSLDDDAIIPVLVTAPSRFGKSTIMNTLKVFCEPDVDKQGNIVTCLKMNKAGKLVEDKNKTPPKNYELFKTIIRSKPLKIYSCTCPTKHESEDLENGTCYSRQFFYQHCSQRPIIFLSLKGISPFDWSQFIDTLKGCLYETYEQHMYLGDKTQSRLSEWDRAEFNLFCKGRKRDIKKGKRIISKLSENDLLSSLMTLVKYLYIQFKRKVLILIDEFDAPLIKLLHFPEEFKQQYLGKIIDFIGTMAGNVLKGNSKVSGALINACVSLGTTLSPYANNVVICRFLENHKFSEYYGFTQAEVADLLKMNTFQDLNETDILSFYNGYRVLDRNLHLYNIFSVLKYLDDWNDTNKRADAKKHRRRPYFRGHGINSLTELFAVEGIRNKLNDVITNESITIQNPVSKMTPNHVSMLKEVMLLSRKIDDERANLFLQYMKDRGYFNIIEQSDDKHVYAIPNGEARAEILRKFYNASYYKVKYNIRVAIIAEYKAAINNLDRHNAESFQRFADSIASLFSGDFKPMNHHDEIKGVLYACCESEFNVSSEQLCQENRKFRCDLRLTREDGTGIIIEVRFDKNSARVALKQIFDKQYYKVFKAENITKDKIYIGLHIDDQKVTICAFATPNEEVVDNFANIPEERLIEKFKELS